MVGDTHSTFQGRVLEARRSRSMPIAGAKGCYRQEWFTLGRKTLLAPPRRCYVHGSREQSRLSHGNACAHFSCGVSVLISNLRERGPLLRRAA